MRRCCLKGTVTTEKPNQPQTITFTPLSWESFQDKGNFQEIILMFLTRVYLITFAIFTQFPTFHFDHSPSIMMAYIPTCNGKTSQLLRLTLTAGCTSERGTCVNMMTGRWSRPRAVFSDATFKNEADSCRTLSSRPLVGLSCM